MTRYVVLLRGVNLGPKRRVPMDRLRSVLEQAGYSRVGTLLQSGNVVLSSPVDPDRLERDVAALLGDTFGFEIPVVVRTAEELGAVVAADPFAGEITDPARYLVSFLSAEPDPARMRVLESADLAPERVALRGREIYSWHPDGAGRSPLAGLLTERRLGVQVTARNWRTVTSLLEAATSANP